MTRDDVLIKALIVYDEYMPSQQIDDDMSVWLDNYLDMYVSTFVETLPTEHIASLVLFITDESVTPIPYKGGAIKLPNNFDRLVSFKSNNWEVSLGNSDVITERLPKRKLQENKFTAGSSSRPVVSIEVYRGEKSLCFWGYDPDDAGYYCEYIKKCKTIEDLLPLEDWIVTAYIYYMISFIATTINEKEKSRSNDDASKRHFANPQYKPKPTSKYRSTK